MLRWVLITGAVVFGLGALVAPWEFLFLFARLGLWSPCENEAIQQAYSPDGEYRAVVFQRNCGATTNFSTQVSIVRDLLSLPIASDNIFIADGHPRDTATEIYWKDASTLVVSTAALRDAFLVEPQVMGIAVEYIER